MIIIHDTSDVIRGYLWVYGIKPLFQQTCINFYIEFVIQPLLTGNS